MYSSIILGLGPPAPGLFLRKDPAVSAGQMVAGQVWMLWSREKSLGTVGIQNLAVQPVARRYTD
jgi:hypothetical protein